MPDWEERVSVKAAAGYLSMARLKSDRSRSDKPQRGPRQPSGSFRNDSQSKSTDQFSADELPGEAKSPEPGPEGLREIQIY